MGAADPSQTVKVHSPLLVQLIHDRLWSRDHQGDAAPVTRKAVENKRRQLHRRKKEAKRARRVFDEYTSIYKPKPYRPKMLSTGGEANAAGFREDLNNVLCCPDCKEVPPNLVEEFSSGDMVCQSCGVVVGTRIIDTRSEWRTFANDDHGGDDPSRVGGPQDEFVEGQQLSTTVAFSESKAHKALSRTQNNASQDKAQKGLMQAYKEIVSLCEAINMGHNVSNAAKHIFKLVDKYKFMKGKPQEAVIAGCIFIACRQNNVPRTFREIFNLTSVSKKEVGRVFKQLQKFLQKLQDAEGEGTGLNTVTNYENTSVGAEDLCSRYVSQLGFKKQQKISKISRELAERANDISALAGRSPLSVAAACIYMACHLIGEPRSSMPIAKQAGVSDGTVKTAYKHLFAAREQLIKQEWLSDGADMKNIPQVQA
ncbi:transcription initiation protein [Ophiocordyceps camponoti-floridani]|uniref:Transcription initiation factor IIB n=1 Tax=Ophiocordyceps camponoti-floridani TaxID=2030778 RepID=A0A8H4Q0W0_9HYPO|nr:transcription initiation protein [Ophiocordyceps camponoti-floridani]